MIHSSKRSHRTFARFFQAFYLYAALIASERGQAAAPRSRRLVPLWRVQAVGEVPSASLVMNTVSTIAAGISL